MGKLFPTVGERNANKESNARMMRKQETGWYRDPRTLIPRLAREVYARTDTRTHQSVRLFMHTAWFSEPLKEETSSYEPTTIERAIRNSL